MRFEYNAVQKNLNLHFWFQVKRENGRIANFMTINPINDYAVYSKGYYVVNLPINGAQFKCMGTSIIKRRVYGCDISLEESLSNVNVDFGLINLHNFYSNDSCVNINLNIKNLYLVRKLY